MRGVVDADDETLRAARTDERRELEGERRVAALVLAELLRRRATPSCASRTRRTRRNTRLPRHASGIVIVRAYHPMSALSATPDSGAPQEKGTRIVRARAAAARRGQPARSPELSRIERERQRPFRFSHAERWKSGRGCSGSGIESARGA